MSYDNHMNTPTRTPPQKLRVAVVGTGYLGRFHAQKYAAMPDVDLVALVDSDLARAREIATEIHRDFPDSEPAPASKIDGILCDIDIASVVVPNTAHYAVARPLLQAGVHVMLEKPLTNTLAEADELIALAAHHGLVLQAGHLERFNPAVRYLVDKVQAPLFIEAHRLGGFRNRATDVDVVLDLMIHDLDIVLKLVGQPVVEVRASGYRVLTPKIDIANARLQFRGGCVANLTASRVSLKDMRKIRVFTRGTYLSADCASGENVTVACDPKVGFTPDTRPEVVKHGTSDNLQAELKAFVDAVRGTAPVDVSGEDGRLALALAIDINEAIAAGESADGSTNILPA